jgi:hypothetical protein
MFFTSNCEKLFTRGDPNVSQAFTENFFDYTTKISLDPTLNSSVEFDDDNFKFAFAAVNPQTYENKVKATYTKWIVTLEASIEGRRAVLPLNYHVCDQNDWDDFYKPGATLREVISLVYKLNIFYSLDPWEE